MRASVHFSGCVLRIMLALAFIAAVSCTTQATFCAPCRWARDESSDEWEEKWGECFEEAGRVNKWADKWAKAGSNVWHERWGEDYDGRGACQKWTDKVRAGWAAAVGRVGRSLTRHACAAVALFAMLAVRLMVVDAMCSWAVEMCFVRACLFARTERVHWRYSSRPPCQAYLIRRSTPHSCCSAQDYLQTTTQCFIALCPVPGSFQWAERLLPGGGQEQWGDKWTETFGHGRGTKHGEVSGPLHHPCRLPFGCLPASGPTAGPLRCPTSWRSRITYIVLRRSIIVSL